MRTLFYAAIVFILFVAQTTAFNFTGGLMLWPDFALLLSIYGGLRWGKVGGVQFGAAVGLVQDFLSYGALGACFFSKASAGFLIGAMRERYVNDSMITRALFVLAATAFDILSYTVIIHTFLGYDLFSRLSASILPQAMMNLAFAIPLFPAILWGEKAIDSLGGMREGKYADLPYED